MKLSFGYRAGLPEENEVVWGARWIFPNEMLPVWEDFIGLHTEEGRRLKEWLISGAIRKARGSVEKTGLHKNESREVVLYEDETGIIKGNPLGSYGFLYVCGYLKPRMAGRKKVTWQ